jgi:peptidoglycan/LPS O-acetylase OafA/YrhL
MQTNIAHHHINRNLEALRGYAALFVVFCHMLILHPLFNKDYVPTLLVVLSPTGHFWVLVFFVLSGYVIAVSNKEALTRATIGLYLKKRLVRIFPIYIISIILTLLIGTVNYSWFEVAMNVLMMQVLLAPQLAENGPAWSLHYEMVYYLLFMPLSFLKLNPALVFVIAIVVAYGGYLFYPNVEAASISSYMFGFSFWIGGLCIAKYATPNKEDVNYNNLIGIIFLLLSLSTIFGHAGFNNGDDFIYSHLTHHHLLYARANIAAKTFMSHQDVIILPFCIYAVCVFAGKKFSFQRYLYIFIQVIVLMAIAITLRDFFAGKRDHFLHFLISVIYYALSLILPRLNLKMINQLCITVIKIGTWIGGISYAIYILHFPLMFLMGRVNFFYGSPFTFIVRLIVYLSILIGLSFVLEKKFQPVIKKLFKL